ncbi:MAG: hypothetical protein HN527_01390, partial [Rhodospirillaceae bacterium]|nr:hypothetical protein [Rhodospirillaceae bacterium]
MALALALIDDVARREAIDQGLTPAQENAYQRVEEKKLYTGVLDSLLKGGKAVVAEQFLFSAPDEIWGRETLEEKEGFIRAAMERENAADTVAAILASAPNHTAAMAEAMRIKNKQVKQHVAETLEVRNTLEANAAFDARARGFVDLYTTVGNAGGDLGAVTEAQWQAQDGPGAGDDKGKPRGEAKAARKLAKKLRQGTPVETDWGLYYRLSNLPPKELAEVPIWDHAEKLNRSEFLLLAERQQQTRAALASGLPVSAAGAPGSLDAQLAALATRMGWDSAAQAETRGLIEREIRAEIAEAAAANGGKPLAIAARRKIITEAAADMASVVAAPTGADDTLQGGAGDHTQDGGRFGRVPGSNPNFRKANHLIGTHPGKGLLLPALPPATPKDIQEVARQMNDSAQKISEWFGSIGIAAPNEAEDGGEDKGRKITNGDQPTTEDEPGGSKPPSSGLGPVVAAEAAREIAREVVSGGEDAEDDAPEASLPDIKDPVTQKIVDAAGSRLGDSGSGARAIEFDEVNLGNGKKKVLRSLVNATLKGLLPAGEGEGTQVNFPFEGRIGANIERELGRQADLHDVERISINSADVGGALAKQPDATEKYPSRLSIKREDISRAFEIMDSYDRVFEGTGAGGEQSFIFETDTGSNRTLVLEMKRQNDGTLAFEDMWKKDRR